MEAFYTDPAGKTHRVQVEEQGKKMSLIQYFDNSRRGNTWRNGRRYNHGTRVRIWIYNSQLQEVRA